MRFVLALLLAFGLVACGANPQQSSVPVVSPEPSVQAQYTVDELESRAERAWLRERLVTPPHDNVLSYYQRILAQDKSNAAARDGMLRLARVYQQRAEIAIDNRRLDDYHEAMKWLEKIAPKSPVLAVLQAREPKDKPPEPKAKPAKSTTRASVPATVTAGDKRVMLSAKDVSNRNARAVKVIAETARRAQAMESRVIITARNDSEGRWIYQEMRKASTGDYLFRANIVRASKPTIELLDYPGNGGAE